MRVLIINNEIPYPAVSGSTLRVYNLLKRITPYHEVWLAAPQESPEQDAAVAHLRTICAGVETGYLKRRHPIVHLPGLMIYALSGTPLELKFQWLAELAGKIEHLFETVDFDIVQIEHSYMAHYLALVPAELRDHTVLIMHDIGYLQTQRIAEYERKPIRKIRMRIHSRMMARWEPRLFAQFARCVTMSTVDRDHLLAANPDALVDVIPNGVDTRHYQPLPAAEDKQALLFIGSMDYLPCVDATLFFYHEVLPYLWQQIPGVEFWIVGKNPLPEVQRLHGDGVHVTGFVESVVPYYRRCAACVVPLRSGGGTRLKILEALALGRPVVSTTVGCEGLNLVNEEHLLIADTPEAFAAQTALLLTNDALYRRLVTQGRAQVVTGYDWDAIAARLMGVYAEMKASSK